MDFVGVALRMTACVVWETTRLLPRLCIPGPRSPMYSVVSGSPRSQPCRFWWRASREARFLALPCRVREASVERLRLPEFSSFSANASRVPSRADHSKPCLVPREAGCGEGVARFLRRHRADRVADQRAEGGGGNRPPSASCRWWDRGVAVPRQCQPSLYWSGPA